MTGQGRTSPRPPLLRDLTEGVPRTPCTQGTPALPGGIPSSPWHYSSCSSPLESGSFVPFLAVRGLPLSLNSACQEIRDLLRPRALDIAASANLQQVPGEDGQLRQCAIRSQLAGIAAGVSAGALQNAWYE